MEKENKKSACYIGKDNKHLITVICSDKKMSVTVQSVSGIQTYYLNLIPQDEGHHHHQV